MAAFVNLNAWFSATDLAASGREREKGVGNGAAAPGPQ